MQEGSGDVPVPQPLHQPATIFAAATLPAPSTFATNVTESVTTLDSDDDSDATGPPEETPEREAETWHQADATGRTREEEKPEQPETPEFSSLADETAAQCVDAFKPDEGCTTLPPPPPPAHHWEGSDDDGSSPAHGEKPKPPAGASCKRPDVAAAKSRLLAFRSWSFSRDKKGKNSGNAGVPSPGDHRPADDNGKAWEEVGAEHKEKGKARWKRLWK